MSAEGHDRCACGRYDLGPICGTLVLINDGTHRKSKCMTFRPDTEGEA